MCVGGGGDWVAGVPAAAGGVRAELLLVDGFEAAPVPVVGVGVALGLLGDACVRAGLGVVGVGPFGAGVRSGVAATDGFTAAVARGRSLNMASVTSPAAERRNSATFCTTVGLSASSYTNAASLLSMARHV
jgi:hypothetical protein